MSKYRCRHISKYRCNNSKVAVRMWANVKNVIRRINWIWWKLYTRTDPCIEWLCVDQCNRQNRRGNDIQILMDTWCAYVLTETAFVNSNIGYKEVNGENRGKATPLFTLFWIVHKILFDPNPTLCDFLIFNYSFIDSANDLDQFGFIHI